MRILLTGADGQLGRELQRVAAGAGHQVHPTDRTDCDITDSSAVGSVLAGFQPHVLVNCAGWTAVDAAESNLDAAYAVNAQGPRVLANACAELDVLLVHISTDYVFDGRATDPIDEWQQPRPLSVYGASKLAGESEVRTHARRHQIVRTSGLYGGGGPNFVLTMLHAAAQHTPLRVVSDQVSSPTWSGHLAPALLRLIARGVTGTVHLTNGGAVSWHGFAQAILAAQPEVDLAPVSAAARPTVARRPEYSVLDNRVWRLLGEDPLPHWREALSAYLDGVSDQGASGIAHSGGRA